MRLWRSRYAFGSIYANGVRYRASHSICLIRKRGGRTTLSENRLPECNTLQNIFQKSGGRFYRCDIL